MTGTLTAYHGDPDLKTRTLAQLKRHHELDEIIQGVYWQPDNGSGKGCAVGCLLHDAKGGHDRYEPEFGIPVQLAWLEDGIFEDLGAEQAKEWPLRFMDAIPVGADLTNVWPRFAVWLMVDEKWGLEHITDKEDVKAVCRMVAAAYARIAEGEPISDAEAQAITGAARDAWAARAAWAAWAAWDARAAQDEFVVASSNELIRLLETAPVTKTVVQLK
jgi:hypothetical protein